MSIAANRGKAQPSPIGATATATATRQPEAPLDSSTVPDDSLRTVIYAHPATRQVTKCVFNGSVSYSTGVCEVGSSTQFKVNSSGGEVEGGLSAYELEPLRSADERIAHEHAAGDVAKAPPQAGRIWGSAGLEASRAADESHNAMSGLPVSFKG